MMQEHNKRETRQIHAVNVWKWLFLVLLGLLLGTGAFLGTKLLKTPTPTTSAKTVSRANDPVFTVEMTKDQVNRLIDYYLKHYLKNDALKYRISLSDTAILSGQFKFLGAKIPFTLSMDPFVLENGDVQLKAKKLAVGALPVNVSTVLNFVGNDYHLPKWVALDTKKETITLHLSKFKTENGMSFRADHIDLDADKIDFSAFLAK